MCSKPLYLEKDKSSPQMCTFSHSLKFDFPEKFFARFMCKSSGDFPECWPALSAPPNSPELNRSCKTEVQVRGEPQVTASNRYENVASLEKGHALLFNKDCQWVWLIRNKMETVSRWGQAEVISV